tara:strand:- start:2149 stop:2334 length:186 start_codon:yes stop_codon:yes gene_type:complete
MEGGVQPEEWPVAPVTEEGMVSGYFFKVGLAMPDHFKNWLTGFKRAVGCEDEFRSLLFWSE